MAVKIYNADKTITYRGIIIDVMEVPLNIISFSDKEIPLQFPNDEKPIGKAKIVLSNNFLCAYIVSSFDIPDAIISMAGMAQKNTDGIITSFKISALHIDLPKNNNELNLTHQIRGVKNFHLKDKI